ncbi:MAG: hypothetical protein INH06_21315, partial [Cupriavidus sp.]|nr:hypothetical protein [Cupriavidus sp.]
MTNVSQEDLLLYARLARLAYNQEIVKGFEQSIPGSPSYKVIGSEYGTLTSFGGQAYYSAAANRLVIAYQGSQQVSDFVVADYMLATNGFLTDQGFSAKNFATASIGAVPEGTEIVFVGHSLGGFHAQMQAWQRGGNTSAVVFNSPGIGGILLDLYGGVIDWIGAAPDANVTYIYSEKWGAATPIHALGIRLSDNVYFVPGTGGHGISPVLSKIEGGTRPLSLDDLNAMRDALDDGSVSFGDIVKLLEWVHDSTIRGMILNALAASSAEGKCFLPQTPITLANGTTKPIEAIRPEDRVMTYDSRGALVPARVTRTFVNDVTNVLDFHGTGVTPGHVFLCGAGRFQGRHVPLLDILRDDGAVVRQDGSLMRASTGCAVGSDGDRLIQVVAADGTRGHLRSGMRVAGETGEVTVSALIAQAGGTICDDRVALPGAPAPQAFSWAGSLPAPEDYVLRQSGLTLAEIYAADEWESPPQMAAALDFSATPRHRPAPRHRVYNFEVEGTHTYIADGYRVHNRCRGDFVSEITLNALERAGLIDREKDLIFKSSNGQYMVISEYGRIITEGAFKGQLFHKVLEVFTDYALHVGDSIESVLAEAPQYLQDALPNLFSALVNGQDFEAAVEVYAANIAANMGIDVLARIFGLERLKDFPKDANGNPIIPPGADPKFFETEVGAAIKGALVSAAVMRILSGKDISPQVYQELAVNTSVRFVVTQALQTQQWATHGDVVERFADWFDFDATAVKLSPAAQAGAAAAASLLIDLLDGGIEDVEAALKNAAVAAGTTFLTNKILSTTVIDGLSKGISSALGATANIALPIIGAIISAAISKIFGKIFGRRPPPPPLFNIQQNSDGTLTVYFSDQASGYTYRLRDGSNDKLIGSSGNDALLGSSGDNELFGRDGNDVIEGREGDDLLGGGKGMDVLYAGTGDDTAIGNQGNDTIDGDEGNDLIFGGDGNDLLFGDSRFDQEGVSHGQRGDVSTLGEEGDPADGGSGGNAGNAVGNATKDADATNNDVIMGGAGNDTVFAGKGKDYVVGSFGDDILLGQADDDVVVGGDHNDLINGGAGNDALDGEAGSDVIYGGVGDDVVNGDKLVILADTPVTAAIRKWLDTVVIGSQDLKGKLGIDKIYYPLSSSSDMPFAGSFTLGDTLLLKVTAVESAVISGLEGKTGDIFTAFMGWLASSDPALKTQIENRVFENLSSDYKPAVDDSETDVDEAADNYDQLFLALGGGDDFIDTGEGNDAGYGGLGSDTLKGGEGNDSLYGDAPANGKDQDGKPLSEAPGDGDDLLYGGAGDDQIIGGGGTNTIEGGDGKDKILSGSGSDSIFGGAGADVIFGGGGDDLIHAGASGVPEGEKSASDFSVLDIVQAGAGSDTVYGEEGADLIGGGTDDDKLFGGAGDDNLTGDEGNDQVFGGEGADDLSGGDGEDALYGGQEGDDLYGGGGNDHLYGGDGNDVLEAGLGDDVIESDVGNDTLLGQIGNDTLSGGDGIDVLSGGSDDDILTGDAGDDGLYGGSGNDEITGGLGNDFLEGGSGGDTLRGEAGSDSIFGDGQDGSAGGDDQIDAGSGDDIVLAGEGSDTVHAGSGNDSIHAGGDNDSVFGGDGNDTLNGEAGNDTLEGESGKDRLFGGAGADSLDGGSDNDVIDGGTGNDRISAGGGDDQITDAAGTDFVDLGDGNDSFTSAASDVEGDTVSGGAGNDVLDGGSGNDDLSGDEGDDFLAGGVGQDILNAGNGEDVLDGGADADTLISGRGKQTLQGGDGNDLYRIDLAGLRATISDSSGIDRIEISANYKPKDIVLEKDGNDLLLRSRSNPADHIRIYGQFAGDPKVETVLFASHSFSFDLTKVTIGTDGDDNILGTENDDIVLALAGKDIVIGAAGDDFLDGGPGKDALFGNMGNDLIHGSSEDDLLNGGADDDLINDGTGSDMLIGGEGRDTFAVTVKAGDHDTIADFETGLDTIDLKNFGGRFVTLKQMEYFRATFSINGSDTIITFDGNQKVTLEDIDFSTLSEGNFDFDLRSISGIIGTASHEIIKGGASADIILGNAGSDVLTGGSGGDTFVIGRDTGDIDQITDFAAAQDVVDLTAFSDYVSIHQFQVVQRGLDLTLSFGSDQHLILENVQKSQLTSDNFKFDVFRDKTNVSRYTGAILLDPAPNGVIEVETAFPSVPVTDAAASRAAQIIAGAGSTLSEGTYSESLAAGSNPEFTTSAGSSAISYNFVPVPYISNEHFNNPMSIEEIKDQFYLANGRYPSFLELMIIFSIPGIDQRTVISINQFGFPSNDAYYGGNWTESIATGLGDDRIFGRDGNDSLFGGFGNDEAYGGSGKDVLDGEDGNDYLNGELDNDRLYGGENNDHLYGEDGFDSLFGGAGDDRLDGGGHDDSLFGEEGYDRLDGGWGEDSLSGGDQDDHLHGDDGHDRLVGGGGADNLYGGGHDDFLVGDVSTDDLGPVLALWVEEGSDYIEGGWGNDRLYGGGLNDILFGDDGNDYLAGMSDNDNLYGGGHNDTLLGDGGYDFLTGGWGDDAVYGGAAEDHLHGDDGNDTLFGGWGDDNLYGGAHNDVLQGEDGRDRLEGGSGNDQLHGGGHNDDLFGLDDSDSLVGGWGDDRLYGGGLNDTLEGEDGNDLLGGDWGDDALYGGAQNDHLHGHDGNDALYGGLGDDNLYGEGQDDELHGEDGLDYIVGGLGDDHLYGGANNDNLLGEDGKDSLAGGTGQDNLYGGGQNDALSGNDGNDLLSGGIGDDAIYGGGDNDNLLGDDGDDSIYGGSGSDLIDGGLGNDYLEGGEGQDIITDGFGANFIDGGAGVDFLFGGAGNDIVYGGSGSDMISGLGGSDYIDGGANGDLIDGGDGHDHLLGAHGDDLVYGRDGDDLINGGTGNDQIYGGSGQDFVAGGDGDDLVSGDAANDIVYGEGGNDTLEGGIGADQLFGGAGADTLVGGLGADLVFGGTGANIFTYGALNESTVTGVDVIADFDQAKDTIDLTALLITSDVVEITVANGATDIEVKGTDFRLRILGDHKDLTAAHLDLNAAGNEETDVLIGNVAANFLDGGFGDDTLIGGAGDDTYVVDAAGDVVTEAPGEGADTV